MSEKLLSWVDIRRFNTQVTEAKVKKAVETMRSDFETYREERTGESAKKRHLIGGLKLHYSRLRLRNGRKVRELELLQESLDTLQSSNLQASEQLTNPHASAHLSTLKALSADTESAAAQESLVTDQLLSLLNSTKQASVKLYTATSRPQARKTTNRLHSTTQKSPFGHYSPV